MKISSVMKPAAHMINNILIFPGWGGGRGQVLFQSVKILDRPAKVLNISKESFQRTSHSYSSVEGSHDHFSSGDPPPQLHPGSLNQWGISDPRIVDLWVSQEPRGGLGQRL